MCICLFLFNSAGDQTQGASDMPDEHSTIEVHSYNLCLSVCLSVCLPKVGCPPPLRGWVLFGHGTMTQILLGEGGGMNLPVGFHTGLDVCIWFHTHLHGEFRTSLSYYRWEQDIWGHRTLYTGEASVSEHSGEVVCPLFVVRSPAHTLPHQSMLMLCLVFW